MPVKPKKSLGQNFLVDKNIQRKIISSCGFTPSDIVLEIGAGRGELTRLVAEQVNRVYALEIDRSLCGILEENAGDNANVKVINQDILKFNLEEYLEKGEDKLKAKVKVVGNIPYYISSPVLERLIEFRHKIDVIFITVQKEFAKRVTAKEGTKEYGSFSCFTQYYTEPKALFFIKNTSFWPSPKVDSCFLRLKIRRMPAVKVTYEGEFFKIIRAAFNKRRKTLRNSLDAVLPRYKLNAFFEKYGVDANIRPEKLSLQDFANLANI
jgi:16S rRNA (adenine1518-N6/adenine1519-N6)-dimethyltransferase